MIDVTVYSSPTCQPCKAAKRWLQVNGVEYKEKDAMDHIDELREIGVKITLPIIKHPNGVIQGFNPNELKKAFPSD